MKKLIYIVLFFILSFIFYGFSSKIDSLKIELIKNHQDTSKVQILNHLAWYYKSGNPDSSIYFSEMALSMANRIDYDFGKGTSYNYRGIVYTIKGDFKKAFENYKKAASIFEQIQNQSELANTISNMAVAMEFQGLLDSAIHYNKTALEIREAIIDIAGMEKSNLNLGANNYNRGYYEIALNHYLKAYELIDKLKLIEKNTDDEGIILLNIGAVYFELQDYEKSNMYYRKSQSSKASKNNKRYQSEIYRNLGAIKYELNEYDSAIYYYKKGYDFALDIDYKSGQCNNLSGLALNQFLKGDIRISLENVNKGIELSTSINESQALCELLLVRSRIKLDLKEYLLADMDLNQSFDIAKNGGFGKLIISILKQKYELLRLQEKYKESLIFLERLNHLSDSIGGEEIRKRVNELQIIYETEKKENENQLLKSQNDLKDQRIQNQNLWIYGSTGLAVLFLVFIGVVFNAKQKIEKQNAEIVRIDKVQQRINQALSHDLKSPVIAISDNLLHINNLVDTGNNELMKFVTSARLSSYGLYGTTQNLLKWTGIKLKNFPFNPAFFSVLELLQSKEMYPVLYLAEVKKHVLRIEISSDLMVYADKNAVFLILSNLIGNSIKYNPIGTEISISANEKKDGITLMIQDNGVGIDDDILLQKFELKNNANGTGLGLHLAHTLVLENAGKLVLESKVDNGTSVIIELPGKMSKNNAS